MRQWQETIKPGGKLKVANQNIYYYFLAIISEGISQFRRHQIYYGMLHKNLPILHPRRRRFCRYRPMKIYFHLSKVFYSRIVIAGIVKESERQGMKLLAGRV